MNFKEFGLILAAMCEVYEKQLTKAGIRIYFEALAPLTLDEFRIAASKACQMCEYWPRPATILRIARGSSATLQGAEKAQELITNQGAFDAWAVVLDRVRSGKWRDGEIGNQPIDHAVRLMGGWYRLGNMTETEITWREKEFVEKFKTKASIERLPAAQASKGALHRLGYNPKKMWGGGGQ